MHAVSASGVTLTLQIGRAMSSNRGLHQFRSSDADAPE